MAMELLSGDTGEKVADLGAAQVEAGAGKISWNGLLPDGSAVPAGYYMVGVQMKNAAGEESAAYLLSLEIFAGDAKEAAAWEETAEPTEHSDEEEAPEFDDYGVPYATSFWDMEPDLYDLSDPAHQQAIWDLMMQPITVMDVGQTEHVYPTHQPGAKKTPYQENCAGELHGQSQGVNILEPDTDGDGYVLIEAYTNDGTKTDSSYMESIAATKIRGYVKESGVFGRGTDLGAALQKLTAMQPKALNTATTLLILSDTKTIDQNKAAAALQEAKRQAGRVIWLNPIPENKWKYIRSVQTMAAICPMVSCNTLSALASACRRLAGG
jgi:hypothetical protein